MSTVLDTNQNGDLKKTTFSMIFHSVYFLTYGMSAHSRRERAVINQSLIIHIGINHWNVKFNSLESVSIMWLHMEPVLIKPVLKKPVFKKPVFKKPVFKKPVFKKPVFKKPVCKKSVDAWIPLQRNYF